MQIYERISNGLTDVQDVVIASNKTPLCLGM